MSDLPSPGGWLNLASVRIAKVLYVGAATALSALYLYGSINVSGTVNSLQTGTNTGSSLQQAGVTVAQFALSKQFTATGGNVKVGAGAAAGAKYKTGFFPTPWTS